MWLSPVPYLQGIKSSQLTLVIKFPEVYFLENHLGAEEQVVQPVFTWGPQLNGVKLMLFLQEPWLEDVKSGKMDKGSIALQCKFCEIDVRL